MVYDEHETEIAHSAYVGAVNNTMDWGSLKGKERELYLELFSIYRLHIERSIDTAEGNSLKKLALADYERAKRIEHNITDAERLKSEICKAVNNGINTDEVLRLAVSCIGRLTNDEAFVETNMNAIERRRRGK